MTHVHPLVPSVTARTPTSKSMTASMATPPSRQALSDADSFNSPYSPLSLEGGGDDEEDEEMRTQSSVSPAMDASNECMSDAHCFPLGLDVRPFFSTAADETDDQYSLDDLQRISRAARHRLGEWSVPRHGRALQRWASVDNGNPVASTTTLSNCRLTTGCIPLLPGGRVVLIAKALREDVWVLPKGGWERDEGLPESALRETWEEAGVTGILGPPLPPCTYATLKSRRRAEEEEGLPHGHPPAAMHTHNRLVLFPLYVQGIYEHWPEAEKRTRRIVTLEEAVDVLQHRPEFVHLIRELQRRQWHILRGPGDAP